MQPTTQPTAQPTTVIFDLGNVFVRWDPRALYRTLFPPDDAGRTDMERFLSDVIPLHEFNKRIDLGEHATELCEEYVRKHPFENPEFIRAYAARWPEMIYDEIPETAVILRALRSNGTRCYALSNWGHNFIPAQELHPVLNEFDDRIVSFEVGLVKPDPAIFALLLDRFGLVASDCLFIDDSAVNVATAKSLGFHTHHFTDPALLREDLVMRGLLHDEV